jgi:beta-lactamase class A
VSRHHLLILITAVSVAGFIGVLFGYYLQPTITDTSTELRLTKNSYSFINPLLDFQEQQTPLMRRELRLLEEEIASIIDRAVAGGQVENASVYYRDLNNGPWLFVNEEQFYTPASLLKVPLMITYFKMAESDPTILERRISYSSTSLEVVPTHKFLSNKETIQPGNDYTVNVLLERMVKNSDNAATLLLNANADFALQKQVYEDFDVPLPSSGDNPRIPFISAQAYASFLRILYNATYLNRTYSERALELLSQSTFMEGIRAGVPPGTKVSDKYGVYEQPEGSDSTIQLHDCGIVYTKKTFVVCVMTSGSDFDTLTKLISSIARVVYRENMKVVHR